MRPIDSFGTHFLGFAGRPDAGILVGMLGDRLGSQVPFSAMPC